MSDESEYYAHANKPRGSITRSLLDFYCPVGEEFSCLTVEFDAVDNDRRGARCLGVSRFQKRHKNDGFASSG